MLNHSLNVCDVSISHFQKRFIIPSFFDIIFKRIIKKFIFECNKFIKLHKIIDNALRYKFN